MFSFSPSEPSPLSLGEKLKDARAIKHLTLEEVESQTKVRVRHLKALEEGRFHDLPPDVFAQGFVRRYARLIGLDPEEAVTLFYKERSSRRTNKKMSTFSPPTPARPPFVLSTRFIFWGLSIIVVLFLFGYIGNQVRLFINPPQLLVVSPPDNSEVYESKIVITGSSSPTATLFINGEAVPLDEEGGFRQDVKLAPGVNTVEIKAINRLGKEAVKTIQVLYKEQQ